MGLNLGFACDFFNLLSHSKWKRPSIACRPLRTIWNSYSKRLVKLLKKRFYHGKLQENEVDCRHEQRRKIKKGKLFFRQRLKIVSKKASSAQRSFGSVQEVPSWSRYVEESIAAEAFVEEGECAVDLSQLFLGQKFASGAHSKLYHGIYQNRSVAVKFIMPRSDDPQLSSRLDRQFSLEVTLLSRLRHSNIVEFVGACKKPPIYCVITEYLPGGSLKTFLHKSEPSSISISLIIRMALDVAKGMEYLHSQGVIHRDLKSDNLIMTEDFHVKVVDFGVSCLEAQRESMNGFMGTYRWMAPEMIKEEICSRKVDVYSFGIVLWELCTCSIPFGDMTPFQAAFAICEEKARPTIPSHCPKELAKLMQQCWSSNPSNRPEFSQITDILQAMQS